MKIFFLLNSSRSKQSWDLREMAARASHAAGLQPRFGEVERDRPQTSARLVKQAIEEGCARLVVIGGDGSLHRTVNELHALKQLSKVEIAVIPAGTCNDFARGIGLSRKRLDVAFRSACTEPARATDLGWMGGRDGTLFLNNAGFGRHPQVMPGRRLPKALKTLRSFQATDLHVSWDKGSIEGSFFMGMACNAPFFSNGLHFSRGAKVNDGRLEFFMLPTMAKWKLLPLLLRGRLGRPISSRHVLRLQAEKIVIEAKGDLWPQADGEPPAQAVRSVQFSIAPEKAMIVAPTFAKESSLWDLPT